MSGTIKDLVEQQRAKDSIFRKLQPPVNVKEDNVKDGRCLGHYILII